MGNGLVLERVGVVGPAINRGKSEDVEGRRTAN